MTVHIEFAVTRAGVSLFKLPRRSDIDKLATDFRAQLIPPKLQRRIVGIDVAADQQRGLGIVQGPSEDLAAVRRRFECALQSSCRTRQRQSSPTSEFSVVADGALNYIPFEALVKNSDGADYASLNYLVKTNEIVYSPSASVIAAIRQGASARIRQERCWSLPIRFSAPTIRAPREATCGHLPRRRAVLVWDLRAL